MKLWQRLVVYGLWIAVLPVLVIGFLAFNLGREELKTDAIRHLQEINILKKAEFDRWMEDSADNLREAAQRPLVRKYAAELDATAGVIGSEILTSLRNDHLLPILDEEGTFLELLLLRASDGLVLVSTDQAQEGKYRQNEAYFLEGRRQTAIQNSYYLPSYGQGSITIATPIYGQDGEAVAVLAAHLDLSELSHILAQGHSLSDSEETYVVNTSNLFVSESRFERGYPFKQSIHTVGLEACLAGNDGFGLYDDYRGVPVIGVYQWLPQRELCLLTEIDQGEAFAPVFALQKAILSMTLFIAMLATISMIFIARTITRPLEALTISAEQIGEGNLDYRIRLDRRDEIGKLARTLNSMAEKLTRTSTDLQFTKEHYRTVADFTYNWEYWIDPNGNYIYTSPSCERISGYRPPEFQQDSKLLERLIHPEDRTVVAQHFQMHLAKDEIPPIKFRIRTRAGEERWIEHICQPVFTANGEWRGRRATNQDITMRKRSQELVDRLNRIGLSLSYDLMPDEIFETISNELKKFGLYCMYLELDKSRNKLSPRYLSFENRVIRAAEKLTGLKAGTFLISLQQAPCFAKIIREGKPVFFENIEGLVREVLPGPIKRLASQLVDVLNIPRSIYVPLMEEDKVVGLFSVKSKDLCVEDIPTIVSIAYQLTAALKIARKVEALRQKNIELEKLYTDAQQHMQVLEGISSIGAKLRQAESVDSLLPQLLEEVQKLLRADSGAIVMLEQDGEHFRVAQAAGLQDSPAGCSLSVQEGICGHVVRTRQPYTTPDYAADSLRIEEMGTSNYRGPAACVPLESENDLLGVLFLSRFDDPEAKLFTPAELNMLASIGEMTGNTLRRLMLFDKAQRRLRQVQALRNIDMAITGSLDPRVTMNILLDEVTTSLNVDASTVLLLNPHTQFLEYTAGRGFYGTAIKSTRIHLGEGYAGRAALEHRTIGLTDISQVDDFARKHLLIAEGFKAYYVAPLITKGRILGVLETFHRSLSQNDKEWTDFLEALADQAAIATENSQLFSNLEQSNIELRMAYDATIEGWSMAMDLRDKETEGHTQRVTKLTLELARRMGISQEQLQHVRRGALLHDIGKLGVPDNILLKPEKLTDKDWEIMRNHPQLAYEMLSPVEYLRPAIEIPYCHHEKWDGSGYPRGLKGKQIPMEARIFAVVDVWDALNSDRPYRKAWPRERILAYLRRESGKHFDPQVVETFLGFIAEGEQIS